jgi:hypothetical protein
MPESLENSIVAAPADAAKDSCSIAKSLKAIRYHRQKRRSHEPRLK